MNQTIDSVKTVEIAELLQPKFPLTLDLEFFSEDLGDNLDNPGDNSENDDTQLDNNDNLDTNSGDGSSENNQEVADPDRTPPAQDDKTNAAFAKMRRDKEALEEQLRSMDAMISQQYGESHGIHTFAEYQAALEAQRQEEERQRYVDAGLPEDVIDKLSKVDQVLQQAEQEKFNRLLTDNYTELAKEYPDLVKTPQDINPEVWQKWNDGKTGLSLTEAYELVNKKAIREHLQASSKQSALNNINSKSHIRGNGGEGADDVDLTSVPPETMQAYRQMFAKELRTGKMKESDFVKHYKNSLK
jgi:hypothetical protein